MKKDLSVVFTVLLASCASAAEPAVPLTHDEASNSYNFETATMSGSITEHSKKGS